MDESRKIGYPGRDRTLPGQVPGEALPSGPSYPGPH